MLCLAGTIGRPAAFAGSLAVPSAPKICRPTALLSPYPATQILASAQPGSPGSSGERQGRRQNRWQRKSQRLLEAAGLEDELEVGPQPPSLLGAPLTEQQVEEEEEGSEGSSTAAAVDLPRLYEHFLFAMAHKGQYAGRDMACSMAAPCQGI